MLKWFRADLHVHTCLSPCAEIRMSPRRIVQEALRHRLDILAVTDHNSAANAAAVITAAQGKPVVVLPGLEICTREEVHVVAIFDNLESALTVQADMYERLEGVNDPERFGLQVIANENDEVDGFEERLLIGAVDISINDLVEYIHGLHGLAIAAHIDRESFGILGHLGFVPDTLRIDAFEMSPGIAEREARTRFPDLPRQRLIRSTDAHAPQQMGACGTSFLIHEPSCDELRRALVGEDGRTISITAG